MSLLSKLGFSKNPYHYRGMLDVARRECHPGHEDMAARNFGFKSFLDLQEKARQEAEQFALPSASQAAAARAEANAALEKAAEAERAAFEEEERRRALVNRLGVIAQRLEHLREHVLADETVLQAQLDERLVGDLVMDSANRQSVVNLSESILHNRLLKPSVDRAIAAFAAEQTAIAAELKSLEASE